MNVFIDTNILLNLYGLSGHDLDEVKKVVKLAENDQITVLMPKQVEDEFRRNRERVIKEAMETFKKTTATKFFPNLVRGSKDITELQDAIDDVNDIANDIRTEIKKEIEDGKLAADAVVDQLFEQCPPEDLADAVIERAQRRKSLGNPPGKSDSVGDAVNWEWLLEKSLDGNDLIILSNDGDFESELSPGQPKDYLRREWAARKAGGQIKLYKNLPDFLKDNFPQIKLADEIDKLVAITKLENSFAFATTHKALATLMTFDDFSDDEIQRIATAYQTNNQIHWIFGDDDVINFAKKIIDLAKSESAVAAVAPLKQMLSSYEENNSGGGSGDDDP